MAAKAQLPEPLDLRVVLAAVVALDREAIPAVLLVLAIPQALALHKGQTEAPAARLSASTVVAVVVEQARLVVTETEQLVRQATAAMELPQQFLVLALPTQAVAAVVHILPAQQEQVARVVAAQETLAQLHPAQQEPQILVVAAVLETATIMTAAQAAPAL